MTAAPTLTKFMLEQYQENISILAWKARNWTALRVAKQRWPDFQIAFSGSLA